MTIGIVGRKSGMTRFFSEKGDSIPVSVVELYSNKITQIKTLESDGYQALQVAVGEKKASKARKPEKGHFEKAKVELGSGLYEFRVGSVEGFALGEELSIEGFESGQKIDVTGRSKGKGFAGGVKRWNFSMQDATHGNSLSHRAPGSIGQCQTPGRVFKGKKMAGHMGSAQVTVQNLEIVKIDGEKGLVMVKGAIPGAPGGDVVLRPAVKMINKS